jgi:hypothetical protein
MLYREIIAVCSQIHTKHINTLCGQYAVRSVNTKAGGTHSRQCAPAIYKLAATACVYYRPLTLSNSSFCPHSVFTCFVRIWEKTAIISLFSINWRVFITETECLLRGTDWVYV